MARALTQQWVSHAHRAGSIGRAACGSRPCTSPLSALHSRRAHIGPHFEAPSRLAPIGAEISAVGSARMYIQLLRHPMDGSCKRLTRLVPTRRGLFPASRCKAGRRMGAADARCEPACTDSECMHGVIRTTHQDDGGNPIPKVLCDHQVRGSCTRGIVR